MLLPWQASSLSRTVTTLIKEADSLVALQDVTDEWGASYDAIHIVAVFNKAAHLARKPADAKAASKQMAALVPLWLDLLPTTSARAMASVLWAACKVKLGTDQLWSSTLREMLQRKQQMNGIDVANTMYAVAAIAAANNGRVPGMPRQELEDFMQTLMRRLHTMLLAPREGDNLDFILLCNATNAMVRLNITVSPQQLQDIVAAAARPSFIGSAEVGTFHDFLWAVSIVPRNITPPVIPMRAWQPLLDGSKLRMVAQADEKTLCTTVSSLASLAACGMLPDKAAAREAVEWLLAMQQPSPSWQCLSLGQVLWGTSALGLQPQEYITPAMLEKLARQMPTATRTLLEMTADAVACMTTGQGWALRLSQAVVQGAGRHVSEQYAVAALGTLATVSAAVAACGEGEQIPALLALWQLRSDWHTVELRHMRPSTRQQLQAAHAWLLKQQGPSGQGLLQFLSNGQLLGEAAEATSAGASAASTADAGQYP